MEKMLKMKKDVLEAAGYSDVNVDTIHNKEKSEELTVCIGRDNREYIWYLDGDRWEACMCIETGDFIDAAQIKELLE